MSFIRMRTVGVEAQLKAAHYELPRAEALHEAFSDCVTDYYAKASGGQDFEARGLLVTGQSRVGKTREIKRMIKKFNDSNELMPDGRPAKIVHCLLANRITWKDLGKRIADALGYNIDTKYRDQDYIWNIVRSQAMRQGVVGIHFDECQHVFGASTEKTNVVFIDNFKTLLKDSRWPMMLIMSGVPELSSSIRKDEQLSTLLDPVHFDLINPAADVEELNQILYSYADLAQVNVDALSAADFFERLSFACLNRWGLTIEFIIEALLKCRVEGATDCTIEHFDRVFTKRFSTPAGFSPFGVDDYQEAFDPAKLLELLEKVD